MTEKEREEFDTLKAQVSELVSIVNILKQTISTLEGKVSAIK